MNTYYYAGSAYDNVTGDCPHRHRSFKAAERCIESMDAAIKRGHGKAAFCDRVVMIHHQDGPDAGLREVVR